MLQGVCAATVRMLLKTSQIIQEPLAKPVPDLSSWPHCQGKDKPHSLHLSP